MKGRLASAVRLLAIVFTLLGGLALPRAALAQANFDRPGGDYLRAPLTSGDPVDCSLQCEHDRRCRAWSFSYPSATAPEAVCVLKSSVPPRVGNACCVSGVRGAGVVEQRTGAVEMSTDRTGGDYRSFEVKASEGEAKCQEACEADNKCRAWSYARPWYSGKDARCFLKAQVKPPHRKPGFTSGVVR